MKLTVIENEFTTLYSIVMMINEERLDAGKKPLRHNDAMKQVAQLALEPSFGRLRKFRIQYESGKGRIDELETYKLNKKQAIAVGAKIDNKRLMVVVNALEEALKPKKLTRKEMALQVIAQEEELERLGMEMVAVKKDNQQLVNYVRKEHAPSLTTISITQLSTDWVKQQRLSAQKITACFYGLGIYDGRFLEKAHLKICSHIPSTEYRNWFKPDIEKKKGGATWYEIEVYQEYAEKLAFILTELSDDAISNMWYEHKERRTTI